MMPDDTPLPDDTSRPSELDRQTMLRVLKSWFKDDAAHSSVWRSEAREDFDFIAGKQWTQEEKTILTAQLRPIITFNRAITIIKAVAGTEINGRHEIRFIPRNTQDTQVNEVLSGASKWMGDGCDAEDEESEAFQASLVCGMGWTESRLDYERDPQGEYVEESLNPLEMYWDRTARKKNLADARRLWRVRRMDLSDARALFPGFDRDALDARWSIGLDPDEPIKTLEEKRRRDENVTDAFDDRHEVAIVQCQWFEREPYWLVADPLTNQRVALGLNEYALAAQRAGELGLSLSAVKLMRRVYRQAFLGSEVLEAGPAPCRDHFSFSCITGEADRNAGTWFGLARVMRDPQKWANKWLSQTLHILNTTAKGGLLAETDAFEDQRQAEDTYARPDAITWMKRGALSGQGAKIMPKPAAELPAGYIQLMEFAVSSIRDVTGINLELIGLRDVNQPGILEVQRKQAAMTILATLFDSLRRFRKQVGRIRLYLIQNFLADGRLIRIAGRDGAKVIPLIRDQTLGDYDVIVDDAPTSPNQKEANWAIISQLLPAFKDQLIQYPQVLAEVLDNSPLPSRLVETIKATIAQPSPQAAQQQTQQQAQEAQQHQLALAAVAAKINRDQAAAEKDLATAGKQQTAAAYDLAMAEKLYADAQTSRVGTAIEAASAMQSAPRPTASKFDPTSIGARLAPDGRHYLPDPKRPGKYLMVVH
jgi:hypothetical protein